MNIERPSFYIKSTAKDCPRILTVNGFEVEKVFELGESDFEYPINHLMRNGKNYFEIILPSKEQISHFGIDIGSCLAEIYLKAIVDGKDVELKITDILFSGFEGETLEQNTSNSDRSGKFGFLKDGRQYVDQNEDLEVLSIHEAKVYHSSFSPAIRREFLIENNFPEWSYLQGDSLVDFPVTDEALDTLANELWLEVKKLWSLVEKKELDTILESFKDRSGEFDIAFHRNVGETHKMLETSFENEIEQGRPLNKREFDEMNLSISYDGRLVKLADANDDRGTILFYDEETNTNTFFDIWWMKKDGKWVIAR